MSTLWLLLVQFLLAAGVPADSLDLRSVAAPVASHNGSNRSGGSGQNSRSDGSSWPGLDGASFEATDGPAEISNGF